MLQKSVLVVLLALWVIFVIGCGEDNKNPVADGSSLLMAPPAEQFMISPLSGSFQVTREFGNVLYIPGLGNNVHTGIDLAPRSTSAWNVRSPARGIVEATGYGALEGNYIVIKHTNVWNGYRYRLVAVVFTKYYHLSAITGGIKAGASVAQGAIIGRVGNSGSASFGAHLHFEIRENGRYGPAVNPREFIQFGVGRDLPFLA